MAKQQILVVIKNDELKFRLPGRVESDGSVHLQSGGKWMPVVNSSACKALGLDPKVVSRAASPVEALAHLGDNGDGLLVLAAAEWDAAQIKKRTAERAAAEAALESTVPGITEAIRLNDALRNERDRYSREFQRMMEDEYNDGARPPAPENKALGQMLTDHLSKHPRAALYLKAKGQYESSHWADNTGKGAAGRRAMQILATGGSLQDAEAALAVRREFID